MLVKAVLALYLYVTLQAETSLVHTSNFATLEIHIGQTETAQIYIIIYRANIT